MTPAHITLAVQTFMAGSAAAFAIVVVLDVLRAIPTIRRIIRQAREQGL